jgi:hypothetical protein
LRVVVWTQDLAKVVCEQEIAEMIELMTGCRVQFIRDPEKRAPYTVDVSYDATWLDAKAENDAKGRTNREVQLAVSA